MQLIYTIPTGWSSENLPENGRQNTPSATDRGGILEIIFPFYFFGGHPIRIIHINHQSVDINHN